MEQRIYHGDITPQDLAQSLLAYFNRGNLRAQVYGAEQEMNVQISTRPGAQSGGLTAVTVQLKQIEDGVAVTINEQEWLGLAASMGQTVISTLVNPWNLLNRLDDLAQDVENLQINEKIWSVIAAVSQTHRASTQISERYQRLECLYCGTANPVGEGSCIACGAPLGNIQPVTCLSCGFVLLRGETTCPNCGRPVRR